MAGDWVKMRSDIHDDPVVFRLAGMLKMDRFGVVGRLHKFWAWTDVHAVDGRVDGAVTQLVDGIVQHDGFADALTVVQWLAFDDRGLTIPKWERHNGEPAKARALKNQRQARWREKKARDAEVDGPVDVVTPTKRLPEKRREDITPIVPDGFQKFIGAYPRSRINSKRKALAAWQRDRLEPIAATIVAHVERLASTPDWKRDGGKFVPNVTTYLNDARWETAAPEAPKRELSL